VCASSSLFPGKIVVREFQITAEHFKNFPRAREDVIITEGKIESEIKFSPRHFSASWEKTFAFPDSGRYLGCAAA
jgi:hypothetical protein